MIPLFTTCNMLPLLPFSCLHFSSASQISLFDRSFSFLISDFEITLLSPNDVTWLDRFLIPFGNPMSYSSSYGWWFSVYTRNVLSPMSWTARAHKIYDLLLAKRVGEAFYMFDCCPDYATRQQIARVPIRLSFCPTSAKSQHGFVCGPFQPNLTGE